MCRLFTASLFLILVAIFPLQGQNASKPLVCGISSSDSEILIQRLEENKAQLDEHALRFRSINYVPVKFHLVAEDDGEGRIFYDRVLDQLCSLNADFAEVGLQFYIKDGFSLINNSTIYNSHNTVSFALESRRDPNAINIWVVEDASTSTQIDGGVTAGYYNIPKDWLIMRVDAINGNAPILAHEVGHVFSLLHPFEGWDFDPYNPDKHGSPAPTRSPLGDITELADGSNCEAAGDRICDTPADYNQGFGWGLPVCDYTGIVIDPQGDTINPDERLHMNYFFNCLGDRYFSEDQQRLMLADYMSNRRNHLRTGFTPTDTIITASPALLQPVGGAATAGFNTVYLEWEPVAGAMQYLVEIDRLPTFYSSRFVDYIATENSIEITGLEPGKRYFWRVRPFNEATTCAFASNFESFTTGTATNTSDIPEISDFSLSPNPAGQRQDLQIELESNRAFDAQIQLYSITGQMIQNKGVVRFTTGKNIYQLPLEGLTPGVYLFSMQSEMGRLTERIIVSR